MYIFMKIAEIQMRNRFMYIFPTILWVFVFNAYSSPPLLPPSFQFTSLQFTSLSVHIHFSSLHFSSLHFQFTSTSVHFTITWCTEYELQGGVALMSPVRSAQQAMVFQQAIWGTEYELQGGVALMSPVRSARQAMVFQHQSGVQNMSYKVVLR